MNAKEEIYDEFTKKAIYYNERASENAVLYARANDAHYLNLFNQHEASTRAWGSARELLTNFIQRECGGF